MRKSGSKMQHVTISACALSARTYNAEVQGSDARLRNHFVELNTKYIDSHDLKCKLDKTRPYPLFTPHNE